MGTSKIGDTLINRGPTLAQRNSDTLGIIHRKMKKSNITKKASSTNVNFVTSTPYTKKTIRYAWIKFVLATKKGRHSNDSNRLSNQPRPVQIATDACTMTRWYDMEFTASIAMVKWKLQEWREGRVTIAIHQVHTNTNKNIKTQR